LEAAGKPVAAPASPPEAPATTTVISSTPAGTVQDATDPVVWKVIAHKPADEQSAVGSVAEAGPTPRVRVPTPTALTAVSVSQRLGTVERRGRVSGTTIHLFIDQRARRRRGSTMLVVGRSRPGSSTPSSA
jgi:hypothetical protein